VLISFKCPLCGNTLHESHKAAGKIRQCPKCFQAIRVPRKEVKYSRWYGIAMIAAVAVIAASIAWIVFYIKSHF